MHEDCFERPAVVFTGNEDPQTSEITLTLNDGSKARLRLRGAVRDLIQAKGPKGEIMASWCTFIHEVDTCIVEQGLIDGGRWTLSYFEDPQEGEKVYKWNFGSTISVGSPWENLLPKDENQVVAMRYYHAEGASGWIEILLKDGSFYKLYPKTGNKVRIDAPEIDVREPVAQGSATVTLGYLLSLVGGVFQA